MRTGRQTLSASGMRQQDLAALLRVSRVTVNRYIHGKAAPRGNNKIRFDAVVKLLDEFIRDGYLPTYEGANPPPEAVRIKKDLQARLEKIAG